MSEETQSNTPQAEPQPEVKARELNDPTYGPLLELSDGSRSFKIGPWKAKLAAQSTEAIRTFAEKHKAKK